MFFQVECPHYIDPILLRRERNGVKLGVSGRPAGGHPGPPKPGQRHIDAPPHAACERENVCPRHANHPRGMVSLRAKVLTGPKNGGGGRERRGASRREFDHPVGNDLTIVHLAAARR
jgi:hypothetical protein